MMLMIIDHRLQPKISHHSVGVMPPINLSHRAKRHFHTVQPELNRYIITNLSLDLIQLFKKCVNKVQCHCELLNKQLLM